MKRDVIVPEYVERFPPQLEQGVLYISESFSQAAHLCCCGCGTKIVTSLKPAKWKLTKSQGRISLWPSIGNSNAPCKSHYVITDNRVEWAGVMTRKLTERARARDQLDALRVYGPPAGTAPTYQAPAGLGWGARIWRRLKSWFS